jgi:hypothetical protein
MEKIEDLLINNVDLGAITPEPYWLADGMMNDRGFFPAKPETEYCLSWDVGKNVDPSALVLARRQRLPVAPEDGGIGADLKQALGPNVFTVFAIERLPLGMDYIAQCQVVTNRLAIARQRASRAPVQLVCDITGCGNAVDVLLTEHGLDHLGIVITPGRTDDRSHANLWHIAKQNIASRLSAEFNSRSLRILPSLREAPVLVEEISNFHATVDEKTSYVSYGARGSGKHDDCVLALGCALVFLAPNPAGGEWSESSINDLRGY